MTVEGPCLALEKLFGGQQAKVVFVLQLSPLGVHMHTNTSTHTCTRFVRVINSFWHNGVLFRPEGYLARGFLQHLLVKFLTQTLRNLCCSNPVCVLYLVSAGLGVILILPDWMPRISYERFYGVDMKSRFLILMWWTQTLFENTIIFTLCSLLNEFSTFVATTKSCQGNSDSIRSHGCYGLQDADTQPTAQLPFIEHDNTFNKEN